MKRILAVGAHPDDVEFGCGGALARFIKEGCIVTVFVMTCGSVERDIELDNAAKSGSWHIERGGWQDTKILCDVRGIGKIEHQLREKKIDLVFTHYLEDTHQDHINTTRMVLAATRNVKSVLYYEGFTTMNFKPSIFVKLNDVELIKKLEILSKHGSQVTKTNITGRNVLDMADSMAVSRGMMARTKYAEGFVPVRVVY